MLGQDLGDRQGAESPTEPPRGTPMSHLCPLGGSLVLALGGEGSGMVCWQRDGVLAACGVVGLGCSADPVPAGVPGDTGAGWAEHAACDRQGRGRAGRAPGEHGQAQLRGQLQRLQGEGEQPNPTQTPSRHPEPCSLVNLALSPPSSAPTPWCQDCAALPMGSYPIPRANPTASFSLLHLRACWGTSPWTPARSATGSSTPWP